MSAVHHKNYDIVIVGGGVIGLAMAQALMCTTAFSVCVIEKAAWSTALPSSMHLSSSPVSALTLASIQLMKNINIWSHISKLNLCFFDRMKVWDGNGIGCVDMAAPLSGYPDLGCLVENDILIQAFLSQLKKTTAVLLDQVELFKICPSDDKVLLDTSQGTIQAQLVVAADGINSTLRTLAGIPTTTQSCLHHAIVCQVESSESHQRCAWQVFKETGPLAVLPLTPLTKTSPSRSAIVWSSFPHKAQQLAQLDSVTFSQTLTQASEHCIGDIIQVSDRKRIPLVQQHVNHYYTKRMVLIGDAAHTIHPLAGQGMNLGLCDVAVLADLLKKTVSLNDWVPLQFMLKSYQNTRKVDNDQMRYAMNFFQHVFNQQTPGLHSLRQFGMLQVNRSNLLKRSLMRQAMGFRKSLPTLMQGFN